MAVGMCSLASPSLAADWFAKTSFSQTVEANDNFFLSTNPKGNTYASTSAVFVETAARFPTSQYIFNGDFAYIRYLGPGAADASLTRLTQNGVSLNAEYAGHRPGDKLNFTASWRQQDIATAQLNDIGVVTAQGELSTITFGSSVNKQLSAVDSLSFNVLGSSVTGTQPFRTLNTGSTWTRALSPIADGYALGDFSWTMREDATNSETKFTRVLTGLRLRPSTRLRIYTSGGVGIVSGTSATATPGIFGAPVAGSGTVQPGNGGAVVDWLADILMAYKLLNSTEMTVSAGRAITPGVLGDLSLRTSYSLGVNHTVNATSSVNVNAGLTKTGGSGTTSDFWTAGASYERRLTREWRTNLSYNYRKRISDSPTVTSNSVVFVLARDVTLLQ